MQASFVLVEIYGAVLQLIHIVTFAGALIGCEQVLMEPRLEVLHWRVLWDTMSLAGCLNRE